MQQKTMNRFALSFAISLLLPALAASEASAETMADAAAAKLRYAYKTLNKPFSFGGSSVRRLQGDFREASGRLLAGGRREPKTAVMGRPPPPGPNRWDKALYL
jgi:hypothetical protein